MDFLSDFIQWMTENGCEPANPSDIKPGERNYFQLTGDKNNVKKASYWLEIEGDFAVGWLYDFRIGEKYNYISKSEKTWTPEQKAEWEKKTSARKIAEQEEEKKIKAEAAEKAEQICQESTSAANHPYLTKKKIKASGARITKDGELFIPIQINNKKTSLQFIDENGSKKFLFGGEIKGGYHYIPASNRSTSEIIICEGFATGAAVNQALDKAVICAFTAGNLKAVATSVKNKYPQAKIMFAADNDWEKHEAGKSKVNTGIHYAQQAAAAIGGAIVILCPQKHGVTDFNDILCLEGVNAVKASFDNILPPDKLPIPTISTVKKEEVVANGKVMKFRILGYNEGKFYYYPFAAKQIVELSANSHTIQNLLQLDELSNWEHPYIINDKLSITHNKLALLASNWMIATAKQRGVFVEENQCRGAGCWIDKKRVILHCGNRLYVNGMETDLAELESEYTYVAAPRLLNPSPNPLTDSEADKLRIICESITWENKLSGTLLAGWLVIAPICAALSYRPHIWLTGEAESGKSTVMDLIIKPTLGKMALCVDGGTTEPAIRTAMSYDARPLIYDEAEPSLSMPEVLMLARKASTGATVKKFGQKAFKARFCACFSAINPPVNKTADESRISFLHIKKNRSRGAMQDYTDLLTLIEETITDDFSERLMARALLHMDTLLANIKTFERAMRRTTGGARASQQIGAMLAGVFLLGTTDLVTDEHATLFVEKNSWTEHTMISHEGDPVRLVQWIISSLLRNKIGHEVSIGELIDDAINSNDLGKVNDAKKILRNYGFLIKDDRVYVASHSQNLARLLKGTEWHDKWSRTLSDVEGAEKIRCIYFAAGVKTSAVSLPLELFTDNKIVLEDEAPIQQELLEF